MLPPRNVRNRYTVKNGISNLYILLKSALKMQEMPFQTAKFQNIFGRHAPGPPLQLCRHYGLPLTEILAAPLKTMSLTNHKTNYMTPIFKNNIYCRNPREPT